MSFIRAGATPDSSFSVKEWAGMCLVALLFFLALPATAQSEKWKGWEAEGDTLYKQENYQGAIKYYTKVLDYTKLKEKEAFSVLYKRSICYFSILDFEKALKDVDAFIAEYPSRPQPWLLKAFIYREQGELDKQLSSLQESMKLQVPGPDLIKWRGLLYLQKEDFLNAKKDMVVVRGLQDDAEAETYLGLSYYNLQQKDSAFVSFNKSIELDATYLPAYLYAGSLLLDDEDYARALQYINLALRLDPKNKEAMFYKGVALIELKNKDEGCKCLNRAFYAGFDDAADYLKQYCFEVED